MKLKIDYISKSLEAELKLYDDDFSNWASIFRIIQDNEPNSIIIDRRILLPWHSFLMISSQLGSILSFRFNAEVEITSACINQLKIGRKKGFSNVVNLEKLDEAYISEKLIELRFQRILTAEQLRNVTKLSSLYSAATFSVPGAGKTTEALAYFILNSSKEDKLLVIAPKNAFPAWDEQLEICIGFDECFVRLRGGYESIKTLLLLEPKFSIISYQQFPNVTNLISSYLMQHRVFVFLDESHRIKAGKKVISESITSLAYLPYKKLIMSGTPLPQSEEDLLPQLKFLYPEANFDVKTISERIKPIYVRTTKAELGLPKVTRKVTLLKFSEKQQIFYELLKSEVKRDVLSLTSKNRTYFRRIGKSIMRLLQYTSNPVLILKEIEAFFPEEFKQLLFSENASKIDYVCLRARQLASQNKKVLIWSSFVENVELISYRLADLGADYIHGGVEAGSDEDADTREGKIKRFHEDPNSMVLVANPAAASEGISLHQICHYAIYVDRTFNAAHYLQSEDRIHRLGLKPGTITEIEHIVMDNSIDVIVGKRLDEKIRRMAKILNDTSLNIEVDEVISLEETDNEMGLNESDINEFLSYIQGKA